MLNPGEDDAEVKIEDKTKIDRENAPDRTQRSKTKIEVEGASHGQYSVVSVKDLGTPCAN
jgi:hypothetical protein